MEVIAIDVNRKSTDMAAEEHWFKSSYSSGAEGNCVEIAHVDDQVGIRDSKDKGRSALAVPHSAWAGFVGYVKSQERAFGD